MNPRSPGRSRPHSVRGGFGLEDSGATQQQNGVSPMANTLANENYSPCK
jgi:hypothetical protein